MKNNLLGQIISREIKRVNFQILCVRVCVYVCVCVCVCVCIIYSVVGKSHLIEDSSGKQILIGGGAELRQPTLGVPIDTTTVQEGGQVKSLLDHPLHELLQAGVGRTGCLGLRHREVWNKLLYINNKLLAFFSMFFWYLHYIL